MISKAKRNRIYARDCWRCQYCGCSLDSSSASIDHIKPKIEGGTDSESNLMSCCKICNSRKSKRTIEWFRAHIALQRSPYFGVISVGQFFDLKASIPEIPDPDYGLFFFETAKCCDGGE